MTLTRDNHKEPHKTQALDKGAVHMPQNLLDDLPRMARYILVYGMFGALTGGVRLIGGGIWKFSSDSD